MKTAFCLSEKDLKNAGLNVKPKDYVQGWHWELRRKGRGMQLWWNMWMMDPDWRVAPPVTPPAVTPETPETPDLPDPLDGCQITKADFEPRISVKTLRQKIAELEQESVYKAEVIKEKYPEAMAKWVDAPRIVDNEIQHAVVKKLCKNQRFVILANDTPVRTGKMLGRVKPGMRVMVKDGTIIKG
jgi:hypothetical protein